jgi:hypothetical protein
MANPEMAAEFVKNPDKPKRDVAKRRKPLAKVSPAQKERNDRLRFYKAFALDQMKKTQGFFSCQVCGGVVEDPDDLQLAHIERRTRGGQDHFTNLMLAEAGPSTRQCHERFDDNLLQWSNGRES